MINTRRKTRPILAVYQNGQGVFKKGKATTVAASITAAIRTITNGQHKVVRVAITGPRKGMEAEVTASRGWITIAY